MSSNTTEYWLELISRLHTELDRVEKRMRKQELICAKTRSIAGMKYTVTISVAAFLGGLLGWILQKFL